MVYSFFIVYPDSMTPSDYDHLLTQPLPDSVDWCIALLEAIKAAMQSQTVSFAQLSQLNDRAQWVGAHAKSLLYHHQHDHDT